MRRALAALLLVTGSILGWTAAAVDAATVVDSGWWDRNANELLPQLDPPPEGALRVANDPAGTAAIAAVRFQLDEGEDGPALTLRVTGDPVPDGAAFVACPTTSEWTGASGAPLTEAPTADCEAGTALGLVAGDGTSVTFDLTQLAQAPATVDVVISPSPTGDSPVTDTFAVDLEAPVAEDITAGGPTPAGPPSPGGSSSGGGPATPTIGTGSGGGSSPTFTPSSPSGGFGSPASPSVTVPAAGTPAAATPGATAPVTSATGTEQSVAPPLDAATPSSKRWIGLVTAAAIIGLGAHLWRADRARAAMTAGPVLGGLGPFARERSAPAPDVA